MRSTRATCRPREKRRSRRSKDAGRSFGIGVRVCGVLGPLRQTSQEKPAEEQYEMQAER